MKNKEKKIEKKIFSTLEVNQIRKNTKLSKNFLAKGKQNESLIDKLNKLADTGINHI